MANGLLVIAALMSFFRVPNQVVVILTSILVMVLIVVPVFIVSHSRLYSTKKLIDFLVFISFFLFIISFFFSLQHFFFLPSLPLRLVAVVSGMVVLCYFFIEVRKGRIKFFQTSFVKHFILFIVLLLACSPIQLQQNDAKAIAIFILWMKDYLRPANYLRKMVIVFCLTMAPQPCNS